LHLRPNRFNEIVSLALVDLLFHQCTEVLGRWDEAGAIVRVARRQVFFGLWASTWVVNSRNSARTLVLFFTFTMFTLFTAIHVRVWRPAHVLVPGYALLPALESMHFTGFAAGQAGMSIRPVGRRHGLLSRLAWADRQISAAGVVFAFLLNFIVAVRSGIRRRFHLLEF